MGHDVMMEEDTTLSLKALVGKFAYYLIPKQVIVSWMEEKWILVLGYTIDVSFLSKGWFVFHFHKERDPTRIVACT